MLVPRGTNRMLIVPLLLLIVALAVIGTMQYRWLGRVSEAERQRMHGSLTFGAESLAAEVAAEMQALFQAFLLAEDQDAGTLLEEWRWRARRPELVAAVWVADREGDTWSLRLLDPRTQELVVAPFPAALEPLRRELPHINERGPRARWPQPMFGAIPALFIVQRPPEREPGPPPGRPTRVLFVQLDRGVLQAFIAERAGRILPKDVDVELIAGDVPLYRSSDSAAGPADVSHTFRAMAPMRDRPRPPPPAGEPRAAREEMWRLDVRHREGGLDAIVAAAHRRNLALASLVLLLLAASSALLIALLRRGERLRAQQAQFIAAMSHELNTPLAVLRVASENLSDGIVNDPEKVSRYVRTIARQTANLSEMVNHVLELAGMNAGVAVAGREPVDIRAVIHDAVTQSRSLVDTSAIEIDVNVENGLPTVHGDERALTRAVQNLVTNALRHAGAGRWVGVRASRDRGFVRIVVEDRGPGIDAADAARVFDAFYRGRTSGRVRGTGLGLTIVRQIVVDHGGSVAVERARDTGAAFVIALPAEAES